jgi:hypothetical protein
MRLQQVARYLFLPLNLLKVLFLLLLLLLLPGIMVMGCQASLLLLLHLPCSLLISCRGSLAWSI